MPRAVDGNLQSAINALQAKISADPEIQAILQQHQARLQQTRDRGGSARDFQHQVRDQITQIAKRKGYVPRSGQYFINPNDGQLEPHGGWAGLSNVTRAAIIAAAAATGVGAGMALAGGTAAAGGAGAAGAGSAGTAGAGGALASSSIPAAMGSITGPAAISGMGAGAAGAGAGAAGAAGAGVLASRHFPTESLMGGPPDISDENISGLYGPANLANNRSNQNGPPNGLSQWLDPRTLASLGLSGVSALQGFREPQGMDQLKDLFATSMRRSEQVQPLFDQLVKMTSAQMPDYTRQG